MDGETKASIADHEFCRILGHIALCQISMAEITGGDTSARRASLPMRSRKEQAQIQKGMQ